MLYSDFCYFILLLALLSVVNVLEEIRDLQLEGWLIQIQKLSKKQIKGCLLVWLCMCVGKETAP